MRSATPTNRPLVAGIDSFYYLPVADIQSFPEPINLKVNIAQILLKEGAAWIPGIALDNSLEHEEDRQGEAHGPLYEKKVSGQLPGDDHAMQELFRQHEYQALILRFTDRQGKRRLVGTPDEPVYLSAGYNNEGNHSGTKGYAFSFQGRHVEPSLYLQLPSTESFYIDTAGQLIYEGNQLDSFTLNTAGQLVATGPTEGQYQLMGADLNFSFNP